MPERPPSTTAHNLGRVYIYTVAAATLLIAAIGCVQLLDLGLSKLLTSITGATWNDGGADWERRQLSISLPLIAIASPIWWLHWRMAQHALRGRDSDLERRALIRNLFFALIFLSSGLLVAANIVSGIQVALFRSFGGAIDEFDRSSITSAIATWVVAGGIWVFHMLSYVSTEPGSMIGKKSRTPVRAVLYLASGIGGIVALYGIRDLILVGSGAVLNQHLSRYWWREPLSTGVAMILVFGLVWAAHRQYALRLSTGDDWWGGGGITVRRISLIAIPMFTAMVTLVLLAQGVEAIFETVVKATVSSSDTRAYAIVSPITGALPFAIVWNIYRAHFRTHRKPGDALQVPASATRVFDYATAIAGLLLAAIGVALAIAEVIKGIAHLGAWKSDIGWPIGLAIGAGALWAAYWLRILGRVRNDPETEQGLPIRRAYLFLVLGGSLVALVIGFALTAYQVLQNVLAVSDMLPLAERIALPLGITVTTIGISVYHLILLRRDLQARSLVRQDSEVESAQLTLVISGPDHSVLNEIANRVERDLPPGYTIEARPD